MCPRSNARRPASGSARSKRQSTGSAPPSASESALTSGTTRDYPRECMRAMVLETPRTPLVERDLADPSPSAGQVLIEVAACGVCRTDLHIVDGELTKPKLPLVPGHQIVGRVVDRAPDAERFAAGDRVGVPWLAWTDGDCRYCRSGRENLC